MTTAPTFESIADVEAHDVDRIGTLFVDADGGPACLQPVKFGI